MDGLGGQMTDWEYDPRTHWEVLSHELNIVRGNYAKGLYSNLAMSAWAQLLIGYLEERLEIIEKENQ